MYLLWGRIQLGGFAHVQFLLILVFTLHHHLSGMFFMNENTFKLMISAKIASDIRLEKCKQAVLSDVNDDKQFVLALLLVIINLH